MIEEERYFTIKEVAKLLGVPKRASNAVSRARTSAPASV